MEDDPRIADLKRAMRERPDSDYARIQREDAEAKEVVSAHMARARRIRLALLFGAPAVALIALALWAA